MRTLVLELHGEEFEKRVRRSGLFDLRSMELIHLLHFDQKEMAGIWRVTSRKPDWAPEGAFRNDPSVAEVKLLERQKDGAAVVFMRRVHRPGRERRMLFSHDNVMSGGGYLLDVFDFDGSRVRVRFAGSQAYVRRILREIESRGIGYEVLSISDSRFRADSLLTRLTDKQRKVLLMAYQLGYYDVPKKINSEELARRLNLKRGTLVEHLRKAQRRLLREIVGY